MYSVVLGWLAALFAAMAAVLALAAAVVGWPVLLLAVPLAGVAALFWYHATGRLTARLREQARRGTTRRAPGERRRRRAAAAGTARRGSDDRQWTGQRRREPWGTGRRGDFAQGRPTGMSPDRARGVLGVRAGADPDAVRAAYRRKVKEAHPDRGGSTEAFKRVNEAYEALGGDA